MAHIWPIGGGKGGTGKSFLTGNLGILLAKNGYRTLLVDIDFGTANLHTVLGIPHPEKSISDFINKKVGALEETIVSTAIPNLYFISSALNNLDITNLAHEQKMKLLRSITKLPYEYILLDLGAGTSFNTIDFFMISNSGILVTTSEPTSIENIYRLIRSVYIRRIRQELKVHNFRVLAEEARTRDSRATEHNPEILLYIIKEIDPDRGRVVEQSLQGLEFKLVLNQLRKQDDPNTGALICKIIERHLGLKIYFIGNITFDDHVHSSICKKMPFLHIYPYTQTASDIRRCYENMVSLKETPLRIHGAVE